MTSLILTGLLLAQTPTHAPPPQAPTLSELHAAKVEAHLAKLRALQLEMRLREIALTEERKALDAAIRAAHPGYRVEWDRGVLVPVEAAPTEPTP